MKPLFRPLPVALLLMLAGVTRPASAGDHYEKVAPHLDNGGIFYTYADLDGDATAMAKTGDAMLDIARAAAGNAIPPGLSASGLVKALGLDHLKAFGLSSHPASDGLIKNSGFFYLPEGRTGIFKLLGGPAAPFLSPALAPAGSDLVLETDLTLGALLEIAEAVLQSTGDDTSLAIFKNSLGIPIPGFDLTAGELISRLNTKIILAGHLDKVETFSPPGSSVTLPAFHLVLDFEGLDFLAAPLLKLAGSSKGMKVEKGDGFEIVRPVKSLSGNMDFLEPVFYHDVKSQRLLFGSRLEAVTEFLASKNPLSGDPAFVKAITGLPGEGNELSYITPAVFQAIQKAVSLALSESPLGQAGGDPRRIQQLLEPLQSLAALPTLPLAGVRANLPDGILFQSNSTSSYKTLLAAAAMIPTAMVASVSSAAYLTAKGIQKNASGLRKLQAAPDSLVPPAANDRHAAAIRTNLQQITFAAQSWFLDHKDATEVSYGQLLEAELVFRMEAVHGESYQDLKIQKTGGTLTVKDKDGTSVSRDYDPAGK